jgi:hypothetical protein
MLNMVTQLQQQRWSISCGEAHAWNPTSDHPLGRTRQVFPGGAAYCRPPRRRPAATL